MDSPSSSDDSFDDNLLDPDYDPEEPSTSKGQGQKKRVRKEVRKGRNVKKFKLAYHESNCSSSDCEPDQSIIVDDRFNE